MAGPQVTGSVLQRREQDQEVGVRTGGSSDSPPLRRPLHRPHRQAQSSSSAGPVHSPEWPQHTQHLGQDPRAGAGSAEASVMSSLPSRGGGTPISIRSSRPGAEEDVEIGWKIPCQSGRAHPGLEQRQQGTWSAGPKRGCASRHGQDRRPWPQTRAEASRGRTSL